MCDEAFRPARQLISVHATGGISILNYFRRKDSASKGIFLPVPGNDAVASANTCVGDLVSEPPNKRRRTQHSYDAESRANIGRYAYYQGEGARPGLKYHVRLMGGAIGKTLLLFPEARSSIKNAQFNSSCA